MTKIEEAGAWLTWAPIVAAGVVGLAVNRWMGAGWLVTAGASVTTYVVTRKLVEERVQKEASAAVVNELGKFYDRVKGYGSAAVGASPK